MKKQLLLSYSFPPVANAESIVTAKMVKALTRRHWRSVVCTVDPKWNVGSKDWGLMDLLPPELEVFRSLPLPLIRLPRFLRLLRLEKFALLAESMPDVSIFWFPTAVNRLRKIIRNKDIRVIHSRAMPMAGHFLALYAKKMTGLPWVAHFCDPWIDGPLYSVKWQFLTRLHMRWEKNIISAADIITFTTKAACKIVMSKYPSNWMSKCRVIPHGFTSYPSASKPPKFLNPADLNIVYLGNFYGTRSPHVLFQALKNMRGELTGNTPLRFWFIGRMPHQSYAALAKQYGIDDLICLKDAVPYKTAMEYAQEADVLLTINSVYKNPDFFLESKMFEYLGHRKPILGLVYLQGETAAMLDAAGGFVADIENPTHIVGILKRIVTLWEKNELPVPDIEKPEISRFKMENTSGLLCDILAGLDGCSIK